MKKIMIFDVPAENGGALSILEDFYSEVYSLQSKNIEWIFVVSSPKLIENDNIKVMNFPWVKKSWAHRLFFELFYSQKLVKSNKIDEIFSLQNIVVPFVKVPQVLYLHQPLPFIQKRFSFKENKLFWVYQNIISRLIFYSVKKASKVVVQTKWMKKAVITKTSVREEKISVIPPDLSIKSKSKYRKNSDNEKNFFYPASALEYKNHKIIIEACEILKLESIENFTVTFTLDGTENAHSKKMKNLCTSKKLNINFKGKLTREEVYSFYSKSTLLFPSYIETFGLPMLEAKTIGTYVFASNTPFSKEILSDYKNAFFFDPFSARELADIMKKAIEGNISYYHSEDNSNNSLNTSSWKEVVGLLKTNK